MIAKGHDPDTFKAPMMNVAYQPPTGIVQFLGVVERVDGGTIILNGRIPDILRLLINPPEHTIAKTGKDAQVFAEDRIQAGAMLEGFATQSGTQTVRLASGATATVAVMAVLCMQPR